jgi:hypothetical protein
MSSKELFMIITFERVILDRACPHCSLLSSIPIYVEWRSHLARVSRSVPSPMPSSTTNLGEKMERKIHPPALSLEKFSLK